MEIGILLIIGYLICQHQIAKNKEEVLEAIRAEAKHREWLEKATAEAKERQQKEYEKMRKVLYGD